MLSYIKPLSDSVSLLVIESVKDTFHIFTSFPSKIMEMILEKKRPERPKRSDLTLSIIYLLASFWHAHLNFNDYITN